MFRKCQLNMFLLASVVSAESEDVKIQAAWFTRHRVYDWKMPQLQKITATGGRARCAFALFTLGPSLQDGCLMRKLEFRRTYQTYLIFECNRGKMVPAEFPKICVPEASPVVFQWQR